MRRDGRTFHVEVEAGVLEAGEDVFALLGVVVAEPRVQRVRPLLLLLLLMQFLLLPQPRARPPLLSRRGRRRRTAAGHGGIEFGSGSGLLHRGLIGSRSVALDRV